MTIWAFHSLTNVVIKVAALSWRLSHRMHCPKSRHWLWVLLRIHWELALTLIWLLAWRRMRKWASFINFEAFISILARFQIGLRISSTFSYLHIGLSTVIKFALVSFFATSWLINPLARLLWRRHVMTTPSRSSSSSSSESSSLHYLY